MDDKLILDLYFARDELAITETERKYGGYCYSIANRILANREDSEETVSDTFLKTWHSIPPHRPDFFEAVSCQDHPESGFFPLARIYCGKAGRRRDGACAGGVGGVHPRYGAGR